MKIHVIPDWPNFFLQLINTSIMFVIVAKFAWKPMNKLKAARQKLATAEMDEAKQLKASALELQQKADENIGSAKTEAKHLIEKSKAMAEGVRMEIISEAHEKAAQHLKRAKEEIFLTEKKATATLRKEAVQLAIESASRLIHKEIDPSLHQELFRDFLAEVGEELE